MSESGHESDTLTSHRAPGSVGPPTARPHFVPMPGRKRASRPKARTGCVTCKARHVRCDERKPTCLRCEKAHMACGGYVAAEPKPRARQPRHTPGAPLQLIRPALVPSCFGDHDIVYFDFFRHSLVLDLSGHLHGEFWCRVVLSESTRDECVQHAVLALGALSRALLANPPSAPTVLPPIHPLVRDNDVVNEHHSAALHHCSLAIKQCLRRIHEGAIRPRALLIITMLLVAYELMQGNTRGADALMSKGIQLLRDSLPVLQESDGRAHVRAARTDEDLGDMEHFLPYFSIMSGHSGTCTSQHALYPNLVSCPNEELPPPGTSTSRLITMWGCFFARAIVFVTHGMRSIRMCLVPNSTLRVEQGKFLARLRGWREVMLDYRDRVAASGDVRGRRPLRIVYLQYLAALISISCCLDASEMLYDNFDPEFREVLRICHECFADTEPSKIGFTFEGGSISAPLILVAYKCRRREIRMKAVALFKKLSWREGAFDGKVLLCSIGLVMLEEAQRNEKGQIPAEARYVWTGTEWNPNGRTVTAEYTTALPGASGEVVKRRMVLDVDRWAPADERGAMEWQRLYDGFHG